MDSKDSVPNSNPASGEPMIYMEYLKSTPGILKIVEMILDLIVFICAMVNYFGGHGWVQFVGISSLLCTGIILLMHLFGVLKKFPGGRRIRLIIPEFIYTGVNAALFIIAGIVAAVSAGRHASITIAMIGCFAAMAVYAIETVWQYRAWKADETETPYAPQTQFATP